MKYPADFVKEMKAEYPDRKDIHQALEIGHDFPIQRCLEESNRFKLSPEDVINAFNENRENDILIAAKVAKRRIKLWDDWFRIKNPW